MGLSLEVSGLVVRGPSGRVLLDVPAFSVAPGTALGVRGPSGAGKSTLLHALAGLLPVEGRLHWGDTDIAALGEARRTAFRAAHIGMIFQDFLLFDELGAQANAALPAMFAPRSRRAGLQARARAQLQRLGLGEHTRSVASFSGGERQRVGVARALSADADVILADEPTASLHRSAADALIADLVALTRESGKTLIAVSHDAELLSRMDRVLSLRDGRPTEGGADHAA